MYKQGVSTMELYFANMKDRSQADAIRAKALSIPSVKPYGNESLRLFLSSENQSDAEGLFHTALQFMQSR